MFSLIVLRATQPQALSSLYATFGCDFVRERHGSGPVHFACERGGAVLEIYPRSPDQPATSAVRLGFVVDDLDRIGREIASHDVTVLSGPKLTARGRHLLVRDCEGHTIELTERELQAA